MKLERALELHRDPQPGEHARVVGGWEIIGPLACPILGRRTLVDFGPKVGKVLWHRFLPNASDKDQHDHPRSFLTIMLRGSYLDISLAKVEEREHSHRLGVVYDEVRAPAVRFRPATHAHITKVGPKGATTLVIMGPLRREWGFWRDKKWWPWRDYERKYGLDFRCDE